MQKITRRMCWLVLFGLCYGWSNSHAEAVPKLRIYGNWCGPGVGNHSTKKPIDAVDHACMLHDKCCLRKGNKGPGGAFQHCDCDRIIINALRRAGRAKLSKKARRRRRLMQIFFKKTRCWCRKYTCKKKLVCRKIRKCRKVLGKRRCVKVPKCRRINSCKNRVVFGKAGRCR